MAQLAAARADRPDLVVAAVRRLIAAVRAYREADPTTRGDWPAFHARFMLAEFGHE